MPLKPAYNTTDRPVVIDDDGHTLGGREWGAADPDTDRVAELVAAGDLVIRDQLEKTADPAIVDAVQAAMDTAGTGHVAPQTGERPDDPAPGTQDPGGDLPPAADPKTRSHR